ncbi:hypothetical protein [Carboxylicivirga sp. M1479]|uniref:Kelch repeat-containing protein n=1 Tax=Carboxylicivirga sp. M1479 TaxID=2594476 RepID=UPI001177DACA|nr:hypothetical protein [Carboxylicivirga sp. M1479]TRX71458.1 hypothetical protein FNN09_06735 [Carboxylicivirga sp. M1479]
MPKPLKLFITSLVFVIGFINMIQAQQLKHTFDTRNDKNETLILKPSSYRGTLQWQKSYDGIEWSDIMVDKDTYTFTADTIMLLRAQIDEEDCIDPWHSDTLLVNFNPQINSMEPSTAVIGDTVRLQGKNFDVYTPSLAFNQIAGELLSLKENELVTIIPLDTDTAHVNIAVSLYNTRHNHDIKLLAPTIEQVSQKNVRIGNEVTLSGKNFCYDPKYNHITTGINNIASITHASRNSVSFTLPEGKYHDRTSAIKICVGGQCDSVVGALFIRDAWLQKGDIPSEKYAQFYMPFQIGETGYIYVSKDNSSNEAIAKLLKYDYKTDTWTQLNDFPGVLRTSGIAFVINDTAYIGGGSDRVTRTELTDFWRYDEKNDAWEKMADIPVTNNVDAWSFSIGERGYILTEAKENNFWSYSPHTNTWQTMPNFQPTDIYRAHADIGGVINNKAYVLTSDGTTAIDECWEFNPITNKWTPKADQTADNLYYDGRVTFVLNNRLYLLPDAYHTVFSSYNPASNTWSKLSKAKPGGRNKGFSYVFNNKVYIGGGTQYSSSYNDFWEYDPSL